MWPHFSCASSQIAHGRHDRLTGEWLLLFYPYCIYSIDCYRFLDSFCFCKYDLFEKRNNKKLQIQHENPHHTLSDDGIWMSVSLMLNINWSIDRRIVGRLVGSNYRRDRWWWFHKRVCPSKPHWLWRADWEISSIMTGVGFSSRTTTTTMTTVKCDQQKTEKITCKVWRFLWFVIKCCGNNYNNQF